MVISQAGIYAQQDFQPLQNAQSIPSDTVLTSDPEEPIEPLFLAVFLLYNIRH